MSKTPEQLREYRREYYRKRREDPEYRLQESRRKQERLKVRLATDPEFYKAYYAKRTKRKRKQMGDPTYRENRREYMKIWIQDNPEKWKEGQDRHYQKKAAWLRKLKAERGCSICGESDPVCLDFHHKDPEEKEFQIATCISHSKEKLLSEMEKCDILCSNCHRRKTIKLNESGKHYEKRRWLNKIKTSAGCLVCDMRDPSCLDFHHRDPSTKKFNVGHVGTRGKKGLLKEIAKCDVICANCHRRVTFKVT